MDRIYKMMKKNNKGFTLVELMVVLLIIGILVAIAIPIYNSTQKNAKIKACDANVRTINGAVAQCAAEKGIEPKNVTDAQLNDYLKDGFAGVKCPFTNAAYARNAADGFVAKHDHSSD
jgi:prepilin-type N-terminal cleavage/methylation domain-containing protein